VHCPYYFGWELRDAPLAVLATGPNAAVQALMWRQWSSDMTLLLHTAPGPTDERWSSWPPAASAWSTARSPLSRSPTTAWVACAGNLSIHRAHLDPRLPL